MRFRALPLLVALALLAAACAPSVPVPATPLPPATATAPAGTAAPAPLQSPAPTQNTTGDWGSVAVADPGLSIRYPPGWTATAVALTTDQPNQGVDLEGAEGRIELRWGAGFGGACARYSALHVAQGQLSACHIVDENGTQRWEQIYKQLPGAGFGARGFTKDASRASVDTVLSIFATLTFDSGPATATPAEASPPSQPNEFIVDNSSAQFVPRGTWYYFDGGQSYGEDCLVALPGGEPAPGAGVSAVALPAIPQAGSYEVFAWWCGNPGFDQSRRGPLAVHRSAQDPAPQQVTVDYRQGAGDWQSLGTYNLEPGAFVEVKPAMDGNVVADAFRFVYAGAPTAEIAPTPMPSGPLVSNNPPSPLQQLTSGDLASRLGLNDPFYTSVPMTAAETTFDDCATFPREGCGGTRSGWEAIVSRQGITLTYRVSDDYKLVAVEGADQLDPWVMGQPNPQQMFMRVSGGGRSVSVRYYPDNTWHALAPATDTAAALDTLLAPEQAALIRELAPKYGTLTLPVTDSGDLGLVFYGLGQAIEPSETDREALRALAAQLAAPP